MTERCHWIGTKHHARSLGLGLTIITEIDADYDSPSYEEIAERLSELSGVQRFDRDAR